MKNENSNIIERYGDPSEFDYAPYLDIILNKNDQSAWVNLAHDNDDPFWERFSCLEDAQEFIKTKKNH